MHTGFGANRGSRRRLQSACCRSSEKNRQRVRRDGRSGRSHHPVPERPPRCARSENGEMGACAESRTADARTDRWRVAPPARAPWGHHGPVAHVHPAALAQNYARPPRWRLGDAPKRMPCAFLCSLVNPSPAFSMTRPEPLPWWARGTARMRPGALPAPPPPPPRRRDDCHDISRARRKPSATTATTNTRHQQRHPPFWRERLTRGVGDGEGRASTQERPRRGGISARAQTDGGQDMSIPAGWVSVAGADKWMRSQPSTREAMRRG